MTAAAARWKRGGTAAAAGPGSAPQNHECWAACEKGYPPIVIQNLAHPVVPRAGVEILTTHRDERGHQGSKECPENGVYRREHFHARRAIPPIGSQSGIRVPSPHRLLDGSLIAPRDSKPCRRRQSTRSVCCHGVVTALSRAVSRVLHRIRMAVASLVRPLDVAAVACKTSASATWSISRRTMCPDRPRTRIRLPNPGRGSSLTSALNSS